MITSDEIRIVALKWWKEILQNSLTEVSLFPKEIERIGKIKANATLKDYEIIKESLSKLRANSKEKKGFGYSIIWTEINNMRIGRNFFPQKILFEELKDYLKFIEKEKEFEMFHANATLIVKNLPELKDWIFHNPIKVIENDGIWKDLIKVCNYFLETPKPDLYIRQLPIRVHTKFIEENSFIINMLLEHLKPGAYIAEEKRFETKYFLRSDEPLIRVRFLDSKLFLSSELSDVSIPITHFKRLKINCRKILITENKMNFLTLPNIDDSIALWSGGGFNIKYLSFVDWLTGQDIYYWGDIDTHGFQILNQMRSYYPQTKGILMNKETFDSYTEYAVKGSPTGNYTLEYLHEPEIELYNFLKESNLRLEQERIAHEYAIQHIKRMLAE